MVDKCAKGKGGLYRHVGRWVQSNKFMNTPALTDGNWSDLNGASIQLACILCGCQSKILDSEQI